jgi:hypothetical protein
MTERIPASRLREILAKPKGQQRVAGARRHTVDGFNFASRREARRYRNLRLMQLAGEISELELQVPIELQGQDGPILTPTGKPMRYIADFRYRDRQTGAFVLEDAKGFPTEVFTIKKAILAAQGVDIREV